eukprot:6193506-Pleurochrysis_carterae.AAC.1
MSHEGAATVAQAIGLREALWALRCGALSLRSARRDEVQVTSAASLRERSPQLDTETGLLENLATCVSPALWPAP